MNKVWVYTISHPLNQEQLKEMKDLGTGFVKGWTAHENALVATFDIYRERLIVFSVNEDVHSASGCSIDKQLRFVKELESRFAVQLLNRLLVAYEGEEGIEVVKVSEIAPLMSQGKLTADTLIYNTAASTAEELENWLQPLRETWLKKYLAGSKN